MERSPVEGLAVWERRVPNPQATLICIHGGLDRARSFGRLARRLDNFDVVAYDRRGYQRSRDLAPLSLERHVDDLLALTRYERDRGHVFYFGHSYGGVVALGASVKESLAQLIIAYETPLPWILDRASGRPPLSDDPAHEVEVFFKRMVSRSSWERLSESERESRRKDGPGLMSDLNILTKTQPFDIRKLTVPAVYVHGDDAVRVAYRRALCNELERENSNLHCVEVHNAGHGAHLANPDLLATLIQQLWDEFCASA
jgi:pimeloyl-ACP methyl ester carboxylesterase